MQNFAVTSIGPLGAKLVLEKGAMIMRPNELLQTIQREFFLLLVPFLGANAPAAQGTEFSYMSETIQWPHAGS